MQYTIHNYYSCTPAVTNDIIVTSAGHVYNEMYLKLIEKG